MFHFVNSFVNQVLLKTNCHYQIYTKAKSTVNTTKKKTFPWTYSLFEVF